MAAAVFPEQLLIEMFEVWVAAEAAQSLPATQTAHADCFVANWNVFAGQVWTGILLEAIYSIVLGCIQELVPKAEASLFPALQLVAVVDPLHVLPAGHGSQLILL